MKTELIEVKSFLWTMPVLSVAGTISWVIMYMVLYFIGALSFLPPVFFVAFIVYIVCNILSFFIFLRAVIRKSGSIYLTTTGVKSVHLILDNLYTWKNIDTFLYKEQLNRVGLSKVLHAKLKENNKEVPLLVYAINNKPLVEKYTEDELIKHLEQWQKQFT